MRSHQRAPYSATLPFLALSGADKPARTPEDEQLWVYGIKHYM